MLGWDLQLGLFRLWQESAEEFLHTDDVLLSEDAFEIGHWDIECHDCDYCFLFSGGLYCEWDRSSGLPEWSFGFVDLQRGAALAIGTLLLARVGAFVSFKTHPYRLRKLFALFVILIAIYILFK